MVTCALQPPFLLRFPLPTFPFSLVATATSVAIPAGPRAGPPPPRAAGARRRGRGGGRGGGGRGAPRPAARRGGRGRGLALSVMSVPHFPGVLLPRHNGRVINLDLGPILNDVRVNPGEQFSAYACRDLGVVVGLVDWGWV